MNLLLLCGGASSEHAVSLMSARSFLKAVDRHRYTIKVAVIDIEGHFREGESILQSNADVCTFCQNGLFASFSRKDRKVFYQGWRVDVVFPLLHGINGEDGAIAGFCQMLDVAFVGNGLKSAAISMDKIMTKRILSSFFLPVVPFVSFTAHDSIPSYAQLKKQLSATSLFLKTPCLGSSIGAMPLCEQDYPVQIKEAFKLSPKILIEKSIKGRELECAILGNDTPKASGVGEIILEKDDFYSYDIKYVSTEKAVVYTKADLCPKVRESVRIMALKAFQALECTGLARVDFLADGQGIYINEVNTMPGFTPMSLYPMLWQEEGLSYSMLIDTLIELALEAHSKKKVYNKKIIHTLKKVYDIVL